MLATSILNNNDNNMRTYIKLFKSITMLCGIDNIM